MESARLGAGAGVSTLTPGETARTRAPGLAPDPFGPIRARIDELLEEMERLGRKQRYSGHGIGNGIEAKDAAASHRRCADPSLGGDVKKQAEVVPTSGG